MPGASAGAAAGAGLCGGAGGAGRPRGGPARRPPAAGLEDVALAGPARAGEPGALWRLVDGAAADPVAAGERGPHRSATAACPRRNGCAPWPKRPGRGGAAHGRPGHRRAGAGLSGLDRHRPLGAGGRAGRRAGQPVVRGRGRLELCRVGRLPAAVAAAGAARRRVADLSGRHAGPAGNRPPHSIRALLETVDTYLAHGGNASQAAAALHLHRNTLAYRLRRVTQITGLDVDDPEARLRLHLALKVRRLL